MSRLFTIPILIIRSDEYVLCIQWAGSHLFTPRFLQTGHSEQLTMAWAVTQHGTATLHEIEGSLPVRPRAHGLPQPISMSTIVITLHAVEGTLLVMSRTRSVHRQPTSAAAIALCRAEG
ncbi:hypothetical protein BaRGS_00000802 [Batillaria attramentaria]|uniref:Uncharacterized protein n=1 Tax=Batillaria attramentaria TaxID=370345 RepID=A0ABD0M8Y1_9CAEN